MKFRTILNYIHKIPGFVYAQIRPLENERGDGRVEVEVRPRAGCKPVCSVCGMPGPGYDRLRTRRFQFVPLYGLPVYFLYAMRRVNCTWCGKVQQFQIWQVARAMQFGRCAVASDLLG